MATLHPRPEPSRRRPRYDKVLQRIAEMQNRPGEWVLHRAGQSQHQAHAYASLLRRTHPQAEWVAMKHADAYATFGRILAGPG